MQSFCWGAANEIPDRLAKAYMKLREHGAHFPDQNAVVKSIRDLGVSRSTTYNYFKDLRNQGLLVAIEGGGFKINEKDRPEIQVETI